MPSMPAMISSYIKRNKRNNQLTIINLLEVDKLKGVQEDFPFGLQRNFPSQFFHYLSFHILPEFTQT